jgi:chromosome segregation ATPase
MTTKAKKTSLTSEATIGQAGNFLKKALGDLTTTVQTLQGLEEKSEELGLQIANKEAQIEELNVKFAEKERQMQLDLDLKMKGNAEKVVLEYLTTNQKTAVPNTDLGAMKKQLETLEKNYQNDVTKAAESARTEAARNYENQINLKTAEFKASEAQNTAEIKNLQNHVNFLEDQVENWKGQLVAERDASIARAKASQVGAINVSSPGGR